jgi:hypothetical protein
MLQTILFTAARIVKLYFHNPARRSMSETVLASLSRRTNKKPPALRLKRGRLLFFFL